MLSTKDAQYEEISTIDYVVPAGTEDRVALDCFDFATVQLDPTGNIIAHGFSRFLSALLVGFGYKMTRWTAWTDSEVCFGCVWAGSTRCVLFDQSVIFLDRNRIDELDKAS